jgi:hypothetical protein
MLILKKLVEDVLFALAVDLIKSAFQRAFQFISKVIHNIRCKKKMEQKDFYSIYIQLDDIISLFLDKYRQIAKNKPVLSRWSFFRLILSDILVLAKQLIKLAIAEVIDFGKAPKL